ncbi:MAG: aminotransferase class V-fold PLP-dependent enzyme [Anaerolineae bacterium]|jgi:isopenicillin-N epimerase|nr:aminotransferase class V-fold PLP-dependent enzyme [Anaerolineae bacterium]
MPALAELFLLDKEIIFLNHGSFGACPQPIFDEYLRWQRELERQPVRFLGRDYDALLDAARARLAAFLHAPPAELLFVPNATIGLNTVARSLMLGWLKPGDEILTSDQEYGALNRTWAFVCQHTGARYLERPMPLPVTTPAAWVEHFWQGVTERTRIIFLSHITSPTALIFPVAEICRRARAAGILTIIDGAHVPGQLPLDLTALGADVYSGNCHKWMCTPKGSAFLHVRQEHHAWIAPLVISHGWLPEGTFISQNQWQGTRDVAAFLTVPAALDFMAAHDWDSRRDECQALARYAWQRITAVTELEPLSPASQTWFGQMLALPLPPCDLPALKTRLYDDFRIEIPLTTTPDGRPLVRVSCQVYNTRTDIDALADALHSIFSA